MSLVVVQTVTGIELMSNCTKAACLSRSSWQSVMCRLRRLQVTSLLVCVAVISCMSVTAPSAHGQQRSRTPHLAYAFPGGIQRGSVQEIVVGGQYLQDAGEVHVTGKGVQAEVVGWYRPLTRGEYNNLRMALAEMKAQLIQERRDAGRKGQPSAAEIAFEAGVSQQQLREMKIFREREADPKRQPNDQLLEEVTLRITASRDAPVGRRELRLVSDTAVSNSIWFHVGRIEEVREAEPNDVTPSGLLPGLPVVVNGQIMPGDSDSFRFAARQGQQIVIAAAARDVIPYLADAVPGWFQAVLVLQDADGRELSYADSFRYRQDPVISFQVPADGEYQVQIRDSLYRGREDFVYRLTIGELPFVTSVYPLGVQTNSTTTVELQGWNLKTRRFEVSPGTRRNYRTVRWETVPQAELGDVRIPLQVDHLPVVTDREPNDSADESQPVDNRVIINGRIDRPGDEDVYRVQASGRLTVDIEARRYGSPLDSWLSVTDDSGVEIAFNDDHEDKSSALLTHHADSHLSLTLRGSETRYIHVRDAQGKGGPEYVYRMHIRPPEADFELRVTPSTIVARPGATVPLTVHVLRRDGFDQDVELQLIDPPPGFQLTGGRLPGTADSVQLTLTMPSVSPAEPVQLSMQGQARQRRGSRRMLVRDAVPADNMMQAFIWYHLVPVENWSILISGRPVPAVPFEAAYPADGLRLQPGRDQYLPLRLKASRVSPGELKAELYQPPEGLTAEVVVNPMGVPAIQIHAGKDEVLPRQAGNLVLHVWREVKPPPTENNPSPRPRITDYGYLPAIPFEILRGR
jgi:hypothetical protein